MHKHLILAGALGALLVTPALAASVKSKGTAEAVTTSAAEVSKEVFLRLDTDGDGTLSETELAAGRNAGLL